MEPAFSVPYDGVLGIIKASLVPLLCLSSACLAAVENANVDGTEKVAGGSM